MAKKKKPICVRSQHALTPEHEDVIVEIMTSENRWLRIGFTYDDLLDLRYTICHLLNEIAERN